MIEVIDNVLPEESFMEIQEMVSSDVFPWCWNDTTVACGVADTPQFVHVIFTRDSLEFPVDPFKDSNKTKTVELVDAVRRSVFSHIKRKIKFDSYYRVKFNLTYKVADAPMWHPPHSDADEDDGYSFIYYLNDADGDTYFFTGNDEIYTVQPKANTALFFKSNIKHCGSNPRISERRLVLNVVCKTKS